MSFSSPIFLFLFLPLTIGLYFCFPDKIRNIFLLVASLLFYVWGESAAWMIVIFSIIVNYFIAILLEVSERKSTILTIGVVINLAFLGWFKYANFFIDNVNLLLQYVGAQHLSLRPVHLPLGISFFTFHAISYLIDIKRGNAVAQKRLGEFALYILLFPQLIAGPIIRYKDIAHQLAKRVNTRADFALGLYRFVLGLGKKVLIANSLGETADAIFSLPVSDLAAPVAWLGIIAYTFQIYFDFSGYSDMAIGMMRMFGFHILENFDYPYVSRSIREFWRRWHISLSSWFRDYVYIPLGGNRCSMGRSYFNLLAIFVLCGFWHGASWSFLAWGLWHGFFLVLERTAFGAGLARLPRPLSHAYALLVVVTGWVFFRAENFGVAWDYLAAMAGLGRAAPALYPLPRYLDRFTALVLILAAIGSAPVWRYLDARCRQAVADASPVTATVLASAQATVMVLVLALSVCFVAAGTYNPFIYFRF